MRPPAPPPNVPRLGNRLTRFLARLALRAVGWRFGGALPDLPKCVIIIAPHTSNWDFVLGMTAIFALAARVHWIGKHTLFRRPFGGLMRRLGGIPVDRDSSSGVVGEIIALFKSRATLLLGMSPEGTRRTVERWKTGFYHIAAGASVPIVPATLDYSRKAIRIGDPISPSGDLAADMERIKLFLAGTTGKRTG